MLSNMIYKKYMEKLQNDKFPFNLRGELEIIGKEHGKIFHYEKQHNTITIWAKHALMHLLTGEIFSKYGKQRSTSLSDHSDTGTYINNDGTVISGEQYFAAPTFPGTYGWFSRPIQGDSLTYLYPYFPVKMLFGTGFEWKSWTDIGDSAYYSSYIGSGWAQSVFDSNISNSSNDYSNIYSGDTLFKTRTMNDIYSAFLTTTIQDTDFGIPGAIKNGIYKNSVGDTGKIEQISGNYFSKKAYQGIGSPTFIYGKRENRYNQQGSEVALDWDSNVENKITFTVVLPEQTGANAGIFYPYNGFTLKVAGLFCDSRFQLADTVPANDAESDDSGLTEFDNYTKMPYGITFAKRNISPITKSHSISVTARWSIYL